MVYNLLNKGATWFDSLNHFYESEKVQRKLGSILVISFIVSLILVELQRRDFAFLLIPSFIPNNHFFAVDVAFTLLLVMEVISLVLVLAESVARSVAKQFEIFALILIRKAFYEFGSFGEPIQWQDLGEPVLHMLADAFGALAVFIMLGFFYRYQMHKKITSDKSAQNRFVSVKKMLSLVMLVVFTVIGGLEIYKFGAGAEGFPFFDTFYTVLIFTDILIVLISLRYSTTFAIVFRNSGFALSTVLIRLALTAPPYVNVGLGLSAVLFAFGLTLAYNRFGDLYSREYPMQSQDG